MANNYIGIVEDNNDELYEGRCKIRILGKLDGREDENPNSSYTITVEDLPWARPGNLSSSGNSSGSGNFSVPKIGAKVRVTYENGNEYSPVYYDYLYPCDEMKSVISGNDYKNSHVLVYDTSIDDGHIKVYYVDSKGLMIDYANGSGTTTVNIKPNHEIQIQSTGAVRIDSPEIQLGKDAVQHLIKGEAFKALYDSHTHLTPMGMSGPPTPSMWNETLSDQNTTL